MVLCCFDFASLFLCRMSVLGREEAGYWEDCWEKGGKRSGGVLGRRRQAVDGFEQGEGCGTFK